MLDALAHEGDSSTVMLQEKCACFSTITKNKENIRIRDKKNQTRENKWLNITI